MSEVACFWTEPTDRVHLWLRRYQFSGEPRSSKCPGPYGYHNAMFDFGQHPVKYGTEADNGQRYLASRDGDGPPRDDERWPTKCDGCDYVFTENDKWQIFQDHVYRRADTDEEFHLRKAPVGAMYDAWWYDEKGPDGIALVVILPPGGGDADFWHVDGYAKGGGKWTRTGMIPKVTATPSILTPRYHGFLTDGVLRSC